MKIWIDALTPKQILFFQPLQKELEKRGYETFCTSRHYREAKLLAEKISFHMKFVGRHGGKDLDEKLVSSCQRILSLTELLRREICDLAISFSSPECARTAFGLGIRHLCVNDSPHAEKVARLTIPLSDILFTPWIIPIKAWTIYGIDKEKIVFYRALDPAAWLKHRTIVDRGELNDLKLDKEKRTITVRLEESSASYLLKVGSKVSKRILDALISNFNHCNIVTLCRYEDQIRELRQEYGSRLTIPDRAVYGTLLLEHSDIFIGLGGTMTAEAALLGIPTISAYPRESFYVEQYLLRRGLILKPKSLKEMIDSVKTILEDKNGMRRSKRRAEKILRQMEDPIIKIADTVDRLKAGKA